MSGSQNPTPNGGGSEESPTPAPGRKLTPQPAPEVVAPQAPPGRETAQLFPTDQGRSHPSSWAPGEAPEGHPPRAKGRQDPPWVGEDQAERHSFAPPQAPYPRPAPPFYVQQPEFTAPPEYRVDRPLDQGLPPSSSYRPVHSLREPEVGGIVERVEAGSQPSLPSPRKTMGHIYAHDSQEAKAIKRATEATKRALAQHPHSMRVGEGSHTRTSKGHRGIEKSRSPPKRHSKGGREPGSASPQKDPSGSPTRPPKPQSPVDSTRVTKPSPEEKRISQLEYIISLQQEHIERQQATLASLTKAMMELFPKVNDIITEVRKSRSASSSPPQSRAGPRGASPVKDDRPVPPHHCEGPPSWKPSHTSRGDVGEPASRGPPTVPGPQPQFGAMPTVRSHGYDMPPSTLGGPHHNWLSQIRHNTGANPGPQPLGLNPSGGFLYPITPNPPGAPINGNYPGYPYFQGAPTQPFPRHPPSPTFPGYNPNPFHHFNDPAGWQQSSSDPSPSGQHNQVGMAFLNTPGQVTSSGMGSPYPYGPFGAPQQAHVVPNHPTYPYTQFTSRPIPPLPSYDPVVAHRDREGFRQASQRMTIPVFYGEGGGTPVRQWLLLLHNYLKAIGVTAESFPVYVRSLSSAFTGPAASWWSTYLYHFSITTPPSWEQFCFDCMGRFRDEFRETHVREAFWDTMSLKQEAFSCVQEYASKLEEMARELPDINDASLSRRFISGLKPHIKEQVLSFTHPSAIGNDALPYKEALALATRLERVHQHAFGSPPNFNLGPTNHQPILSPESEGSWYGSPY